MFTKITRYRLLPLILCMVLLFGFAGTASAAISEWDGIAKTAFTIDADHDGTAAKPYLIESAAQLAYLADKVNANTNYAGIYFKLTTDIDLKNQEWTPIGIGGLVFDSYFDGDGHKILNLTIAGNKSRAGLFGSAQREIKNLHLVNVWIKPSDSGADENFVGGIAATAKGKITGCSVSGALRGNISTKAGSLGSYTGGIVGLADTAAVISDCSANVTITGGECTTTDSFTGGIAGEARAAINGSMVSGTVTGGKAVAGNSYTGGVVGYVRNLMKECSVFVEVNGGEGKGSYTGGVAGYAESTNGISTSWNAQLVSGGKAGDRGSYTGGIVGKAASGTKVTNCSVSGRVLGGDSTSGVSVTGGIAGEAGGSVSLCWSSGRIDGGKVSTFDGMTITGGIAGGANTGLTVAVSQCYSFGAIVAGTQGAMKHTGGIVGYLTSGTIASSYWNSGAAAQGATAGVGRDTGAAQEPKTVKMPQIDFKTATRFDQYDAGAGVWKDWGTSGVGNAADKWDIPSGGWFYPAFDDTRPRQTAFFDNPGGGAIFPSAVLIVPSVVIVKGGEASQSVKITVAGFDDGQVEINSATPAPAADATFTYASNAVTVVPKAVTTVGAATVTVNWKLGGVVQTPVTFDLVTRAGSAAAVSKPTANPAGGDYAVAQSVTLSCATAGADIYYTLDGTNPTSQSTRYAGPVSVSSSPSTLKAIAVKAGMADSTVMSESYTITAAGTVAAPKASPGGGTYAAAQSVTLSSATAGASIHYTLDGSNPTAASTAYANPITISSSSTLKAIAVKAGMTNSTIMSESYTIGASSGTVAMPAASPAGGTYATAQSVTLSSATTGANIYYTLDGSNPTAASTAYTSPVAISSSAMLRAIGIKAGMTNSTVMSEAYTIGTPLGTVATPVANPAGGSFSSAVNVTLACATSGAEIRYTLDGTAPVSSSTLYTGPISIGATKTLKAIAIKAGYTNSLLLTQTYTIAASGGAVTKSGGSGGCDAGAMGLAAVGLFCALRLSVPERSRRTGHDGCDKRK